MSLPPPPSVATPAQQLAVVAELPAHQGALKVRVDGLQVGIAHGPILEPSPVLLPVRPLGPPDICTLFAELCRQGLIFTPGPLAEDGTPTWHSASDWQFQLRLPESPNGPPAGSRLILPA